MLQAGDIVEGDAAENWNRANILLDLLAGSEIVWISHADYAQRAEHLTRQAALERLREGRAVLDTAMAVGLSGRSAGGPVPEQAGREAVDVEIPEAGPVAVEADADHGALGGLRIERAGIDDGVAAQRLADAAARSLENNAPEHLK